MKSQALIMNVIGAVLLFVGILVHIVCMATPHMGGIDYPSIKDDVQRILAKYYQSSRNMRRLEDTLNQFLAVEVNFGPWKLCRSARGRGEICDDWEEAPDWIKATQAFSLLGVLTAISALAVSAISLFLLLKGNWKKILPLAVCGLACGAAALIIVEAIIFAAKYDEANQLSGQLSTGELGDVMDDALYLDWGFGLDIVAAILLIVAGLIHFLGGRAAQREGTV